MIGYIMMLGMLLVIVAVYPTHLMYATPKLTIIYSVVAIMSIMSVFGRRSIRIPLPKNPYLFITMIGLFVASALFNWPGPYEFSFIHWLTFFMLVIFSYNYTNVAQFQRWVRYATVLVVLLGLMEFFELSFLKGTWIDSSHDITSTMGNKNYLSTFLGFSLIMQVFPLSYNGAWKRHVPLMVLTLFVIALCNCRSSSVAILAGLLFLLVGKSFKKKIILTSLAVILLAGGSYFLRDYTANTRITMWKNASKMIQDRPLTGFGPHKYVSAHSRYKNSVVQDPVMSDTVVESHPHNSYVETAVENGVPFLVVLLIILSLLFYRVHERKVIFNNDKRIRLMFMSLGVFLVVESFFSFPLWLPAIYMLSAITLGQVLMFVHNRTTVSTLDMRALLFLIAIYFSIASYRRWVSHYDYHYNYIKLEKIQHACDSWSSSWVVCMRRAEVELTYKKYYQSEQTLNKILDMYPGLYPAIGTLSKVKASQGKKKEACDLYRQYVNILRRGSDLDQYLKPYCGE